MKVKNKKFLTSPSDLNNFVSCKYLIQNDIKYLHKEIRRNEESIDQIINWYQNKKENFFTI